LVSIKNLNYSVDKFSLTIPDLIFKENQITLISGPSGSGKTTLFNLLIGTLTTPNWSFIVDGVELSQAKLSERKLGVVFQNYELFPHLTAEENITIVMQSRENLSPASLKQLQDFKIKLKLEHCWSTRAQNLSGGEKQRVALLRAVMSQPRLLLLDEPFAALDESNRHEAREIVQQVLNELKITTLLISHDEKDLQIFGANVVRLDHGRVV
jgi:ABC-type sugar transport system ATPase subunit